MDRAAGGVKKTFGLCEVNCLTAPARLLILGPIEDIKDSSKELLVPQSVLDAIRMGVWDYEPENQVRASEFDSTQALPGTDEKLSVLASRLASGLPLWHPSDRRSYDDGIE